jgi:hypothetical protein
VSKNTRGLRGGCKLLEKHADICVGWLPYDSETALNLGPEKVTVTVYHLDRSWTSGKKDKPCLFFLDITGHIKCKPKNSPG